MKTIIFNDPHLGLNRVANTTPASRLRLRDLIAETALGICEANKGTRIICGGDLFDKAHNDDRGLTEAVALLPYLSHVMAGNHDVVNRTDVVTSFEMLQSISKQLVHQGTEFHIVPFGERGYKRVADFSSPYAITMVPHHATPELFHDTLRELVANSARDGKKQKQTEYLLLHCNYNSPQIHPDSSLDVSPAMVDELLKVYDYIVLAHEHNPRELHGGRLLITGNTHPTGFGDVGPKRYLEIDEEGQPVWHWLEATEEIYKECKVNDCLTEQAIDIGKSKFIRITGMVEPAYVMALAKTVKATWKEYPEIIGIKVDVTVNRAEVSTGITDSETLDIPALVAESLKEKEPDLFPLWEQVTSGG